MVASVPLFTKRTTSTDGSASAITSASSYSRREQAPKLRLFSAVRRTASITAGWAWPAIIGPQLPTRST